MLFATVMTRFWTMNFILWIIFIFIHSIHAVYWRPATERSVQVQVEGPPPHPRYETGTNWSKTVLPLLTGDWWLVLVMCNGSFGLNIHVDIHSHTEACIWNTHRIIRSMITPLYHLLSITKIKAIFGSAPTILTVPVNIAKVDHTISMSPDCLYHCKM